LLVLETFRKEAETTAQCFYAYLTVHTLATDDQQARHAVNQDITFWQTTLYALQAATFIALHRLFDGDSEGCADKLLRFAESYASEVLARDALRARASGTWVVRGTDVSRRQ
jgi:molybdopterin/thiamine biosynthesis adenylyltransferase